MGTRQKKKKREREREKAQTLASSKWVKVYVDEDSYFIKATLLSDFDTKVSIMAVTFVGCVWINRYSLLWVIKTKGRKTAHMVHIIINFSKFFHF